MNRMPEDTVPGRLMAEIHYYTPCTFTLMERDRTWGKMSYYWDHNHHSSADPDRNATRGEAAAVDRLFGLMEKQFVDRSIPVIPGEYCATRRAQLPDGGTDLHLASRTHYHRCGTRQAKAMGLIPFYWDNGGTGNNASGIFDRHARALFNRKIMDALRVGATEPSYWATIDNSPRAADANPDGEWAGNLLELYLGNDPLNVNSVPPRPTLRIDNQNNSSSPFTASS